MGHDTRDNAKLLGRPIEGVAEAIEKAVVEECGEERREGLLGAGDAEAWHAVEGTGGVVGHGSRGVERDEADEETLGAGGGGFGEAGIEEALDEVGAAGAGELLDGKGEEGPLGVEAREGGGGLEELGDAVGVRLGTDGGFEAGEGSGRGGGRRTRAGFGEGGEVVVVVSLGKGDSSRNSAEGGGRHGECRGRPGLRFGVLGF